MNKTKQFQTILYLGALWGIAEATIGHLLHFLPCGFSGMFMFPIGFYFMYNAYEQTESQKAILLTGLIAASIKLFNIFTPFKSIMSVTNPAMSIVLESLVVFGFVKISKNVKSFLHTTLLGFSWVVLFILSQALIFKPAAGLYLYPIHEMVAYIIINSVVSGIIVGSFLQKEDFLAWRPTLAKQTYWIPLFVFQLAVVLEIVNSIII